MTPEREAQLRRAMARYVQSQLGADAWRRRAAQDRELLMTMLRETAGIASGKHDTTGWPADLAALLAWDKEDVT